MLEIIAIHERKARKEHTCDTCGSIIHKGEKYQNQTIGNEGCIYDWKQCFYCKSIVDKMIEEYPFLDGYTDQDFENYLADNPEIEFKRRQ